MKTLGLIGGTSWHSTVEYYKCINEQVNNHFGDNTNPPLLVFTLNQSLIHQFQKVNNWEGIAELLIEASKRLEKAGADMLMFCANTPHKVYEIVEQEINTPILHIADATSNAILSMKIKTVCFLGTKYSMSEEFITQRIASNNIKVITPKKQDQINELHRIIHEELTYGTIVPQSKEYIIKVIQSCSILGAEGIVLGCTEFPLIIKETDIQIPIFNTTEIHASAGTKFILEDLKI